MKRCPTCKASKNVSEFSASARRADGLQSECKECKRTRDAEYFQKNKERILAERQVKYGDKNRARKYGISLEELTELRSRFKNKCHVCKIEDGAVVDHCHKNLNVRGWLCQACNKGLGFFRDNPEYLQNAVEYLNAR